jgi:hypothetical protein
MTKGSDLAIGALFAVVDFNDGVYDGLYACLFLNLP